MIRSLHTAATGMQAQQSRMDVTANNLANANTTGFKRVRTEFEDLFYETVERAQGPDVQTGGRPAPTQFGLGVRTAATTRAFSQGDLIGTNNPLDVAIEGEGFFRVRLPDGGEAYTRAGNFRLDAMGRLVTQRGEVVEPEILVPSDATDLTIGGDGRVAATIPGRTDPLELGTLELAVFVNAGGLEGLGGNLFRATEASGVPMAALPGEQRAGSLSQGYLEGSNVEAVTEMIEMITTQRAYEMTSKVIQASDQMLQRLANLR